MRFLDTNVVLRLLTRDDEARAKACYELFERVEAGEEELFTCEATVAEVAYVLSSARGPYRLSREEIAARLRPILALRGLRLPQKHVCMHALDVYGSSRDLDIEDALAVAHMARRNMTEIVSYDRDFDGLPGIRRIEPEPRTGA